VTASKPKRVYAPRIVSDHVMVQEDFERLHKFLLETEATLPTSRSISASMTSSSGMAVYRPLQ
jgi:hypothetical protein